MKRITIEPEMQRVIDAYIILINNDARLSDIGVQMLINILKEEWGLK